jgi:hypothetical protein
MLIFNYLTRVSGSFPLILAVYTVTLSDISGRGVRTGKEGIMPLLL